MDGKKDMVDPKDRAPFDDPDAPPSAEEIAASERLREALEDPTKENADAELARALSLAHATREIDEREHRAIVARGVAEGSRRARAERRGVVVRIAFGVTAGLAIAASALLFVGVRSPARMELAMTRSTQPLFPERFPQTGGESDRIDRIAMSRGADLRENRFSRWGVPASSPGGGR
jgi:hypothetical protein